jgi:phosphatidylinositol alpha-mannosyltransferase
MQDDVRSDGNVYTLGRVTPVPANGSVARITLSLLLSKRIRTILRNEAFDVVHVHEPLLPALPITVMRFSHALNIGTFHAYSRGHRGYFYGRPFLRRYFARLDGKIAVSPAALGFVSQYFPGDYTVIPNGIDVAQFQQPAVRDSRFDDGKLNVLFLGRLEKRKGLKYLLRAFPRVQARCGSVRLIVAGDGPLRVPFERWVERHHIRDVVFVGGFPEADKAALYAAAHVFCAPSTGQESFGIVLLEAMAAGKAIVASDNDGYRMVVTGGVDGLLVEPRNEQSLTEALCGILQDRDMREQLGRAASAKAWRYDWREISGDVLRFYQRTARQKEPSAPFAGMPVFELEGNGGN